MSNEMSMAAWRELPLTQGQVALVDADDYERVSQYKWYAIWSPQMRCFYAARNVRINGKQLRWSMQNFILGIPPRDRQYVGDHIDQSQTLDNRRANIRIATHSQQVAHTRLGRRNKLGYKGLSPMRDSIQAGIRVHGKRIYLGTFRRSEIVKAALAYDAAAQLYFGEFAHVNFPQRESAHE